MGAYTTWLGESGYYFDGVLKYNRFQNKSDVQLSDGKKTKGHYNHNGIGASLEFGRHIKLDNDYFVEPYTQLSGVIIQGKEYDLDNGLSAEGDRTRSLLGKVGATAGRNKQLIRYVYKPQLGEEPWFRYLPGENGEITAEYEYDKENAHLKLCQSEGLSLRREYYSTGEVKMEVRSQGDGEYTMFYGNSCQGRQLDYTDVLKHVQLYGYDLQGRLVHTELGTTSSNFTYDDLGRLSAITTQDGSQEIAVLLCYDNFDRETTRTFKLNDIEQELTQAYNEVDALIQRTLKEGAEVLRDEKYDYDPRGRLTTYTCEGSQPPMDPYNNEIRGQTFKFDAMDNLTGVITKIAEGENVARYLYENPDKTQLTRITNTNTGANYPAEITLEYDQNGNLVRDEQNRELVYDALNRLLSVSELPDETRSDFKYDPLDTLVGSSSGGSEEQRFYQNGQPVNLVEGLISTTFVRTENGLLAELQEGADPKTLLLAVDHKNTVIRESGKDVANDIAYSAYGHPSAERSVNTRLGYNGEFSELQTGWQLLGNGYRAYNPRLMRFHSPDSLSPFGEGGMNAYMYCGGNPIDNLDRDGHAFSLASITGWFRGLFGRARMPTANTSPSSRTLATYNSPPSPSPSSKSSVNYPVQPNSALKYREEKTPNGVRISRDNPIYQSTSNSRPSAGITDEFDFLSEYSAASSSTSSASSSVNSSVVNHIYAEIRAPRGNKMQTLDKKARARAPLPHEKLARRNKPPAKSQQEIRNEERAERDKIEAARRKYGKRQ